MSSSRFWAKAWFNRRFPYYRRCWQTGCWRGQTYDGLCAKHNRAEYY